MGIEIKGQRDGFYIIVDEKLSFIEAREKLIEKFEESKNFFRGAKFFKLEAPSLNKIDIKYLRDYLSENYSVSFVDMEKSGGDGTDPIANKNISSSRQHDDIRMEDIASSTQKLNERLSSFDETLGKLLKITSKEENNEAHPPKEDTNLKTKFLFENMRSGSEVDYDGNIVIFGDVNPGAKIVARGNIIVMGSFRGMAHAGRKNNEDCFIAALKLLPLQIRINDVFAVPPQDAKIIENAMVIVKNGEIEIEQF